MREKIINSQDLGGELCQMVGIFHDLEFMERLCDREFNTRAGGFVEARHAG